VHDLKLLWILKKPGYDYGPMWIGFIKYSWHGLKANELRYLIWKIGNPKGILYFPNTLLY
jgi:hypothetical protein